MINDTHVGFTGTQYGMTLTAAGKLTKVLGDFKIASVWSSSPLSFHHGDCMGADDTAARIASEHGFLVHAHPPFKENKRAFSQYNDVIHAPKDYIDRNHDIVDVSSLLIATPYTMKEVIRSGTWATIRYARKLNRELCIIFPDGSMNWENSARADGREAS